MNNADKAAERAMEEYIEQLPEWLRHHWNAKSRLSAEETEMAWSGFRAMKWELVDIPNHTFYCPKCEGVCNQYVRNYQDSRGKLQNPISDIRKLVCSVCDEHWRYVDMHQCGLL